MTRAMILLSTLALTLLSPNLVQKASAKYEDNWLASMFQSILEKESKPANKSANKAADRMWLKLCVKLREDIDCSKWTRPNVRTFAPNPLRPGLQGYYDGTNIIYIRQNLYAGSREEVLAHEMSHYVDQLLGLLPPMPIYSDDTKGIIALCMSEKTAWGVSDEYHRTQFWGNLKLVVGKRWVSWYTHCTPHRAILYP